MFYPASERNFDGNRDDAGVKASVERADESNGVVVGKDERDAIARLDAHLRLGAQLVQQGVRYLIRPALQFTCWKAAAAATTT